MTWTWDEPREWNTYAGLTLRYLNALEHVATAARLQADRLQRDTIRELDQALDHLDALCKQDAT